MALRSVVVQPPASPPAPRRTVVVRAGGPAPKGRLLDIIVGVLGVLILIAAIGLAQVLPDKTYLNPQFRLTFAEVNQEGPGSQDFHFLQGSAEVYDFTYEVAEDNVKSVTLVLGITDDVSYSLPDRFSLDLIAPNGTIVGHFELQNPDPDDGSAPADPPSFSIAEEEPRFDTAPTHSEQIITGLTHVETAEQVLARLEPQYRTLTKGLWTVRVTLVAAGACPEPGQGYPSQAYHCRFGHPSAPDGKTSQDGTDAGNTFLLANFRYTYYIPEVKELK